MPYELKEMNKLYHVVSNNINNKNQCDDAIEYETKFDSKFSLSSGPNRDPYYSYLSSDSDWYKRRNHVERTEMNMLYHIVMNNIKNKNQCDDAIEYEPKFYNKFSLSSGPNRDPF